MIFFTADTHFGHTNIIRYCQRPFRSIEEHDATLITNWNAAVRPDDEVYVLGDFIFAKNVEEVESVTKRLNGRKYLVRGNHDRLELCQNYFEWIKDYHEMTAHNLKWVLFHYPIHEWHGKYRSNGAVHLHGHTHNKIEKNGDPSHTEISNKRRLNVGVDLNGFTPIRANTLASRLIREAREAHSAASESENQR